MIRRNLKEIQTMAQGHSLKNLYEGIYIEGVSTDSRTIGSNQLFIPLLGEFFNGHDFIGEAMEKGAGASLWQQDIPLPNVDFPFIMVDNTLTALHRMARTYREGLKNLQLIGVTGSNGKTTTKDIVASIFKSKYRTKSTRGNLNNLIGTPLTILDLDEDTEVAVVEMATDKFGEISTLTSLVKPDVALITNIGEAHLEDLITRENIGRAKLEILEGMDENGLLIYYGEDKVLEKIIASMDIKQKIVRYGSGDHNDYICKLEKVEEFGLFFNLKKPERQRFFLPLLGGHNMYNATGAIAIARHFEIPYILIKKGMIRVEKTSMRNELIQAQGYSILNDSYKSNPSSVLVALDTLYSMANYSHKIAVLGDMLGLGEDEVEMHEEIGRKIDPNQIDYLITIGQLGKHIAEAASPHFEKARIISCSNKEELVKELKKVIRPNSISLVKASRPLGLEEVVYRLKDELVLSQNKLG